MKPVRLLIIDDELPPAPESSPERLSLLSEWDAEEVPIQEPPPQPVSDLKIEVALTTGEDDEGNYTFEAIRDAVTSGIGPEGWSLILLDVTFGSKNHFGERVREKLLAEFPDLPLLLLTARAEYELQNTGVPYRSKNELSRRNIVEDVLEDGSVTNEQRCALLELEDEVAASSVMLERLQQTYQWAADDIEILLLGEPGVGKGVLARYIHRVSARNGQPYVAKNMARAAAGDPSLVDIMLFGRKKNYPNKGDAEMPGLFGRVEGGTLFLDEVAELPLQTQGMLLRALEDKRYRRPGDDHDTEADVRLLAATNQDIEQLAQKGAFRKDLLARVQSATLRIPPLRERPEDIVPLAEHFLDAKMEGLNLQGVKWSREAKRTLQTFPFYGNVRQLEKLVRRVLLGKGSNTLISEQDVREVKEDQETAIEPSENEGRETAIEPSESGTSSPETVLTLANLEQKLAALPVSENDPALTGSLDRLEKAVAKLKKRLAGAALESERGFGSDDPDRTKAVSLLRDDLSLSSQKAARTLCKILGVKQRNRFTSEQIETLLNAWKQGPPRGTAPQDSADTS